MKAIYLNLESRIDRKRRAEKNFKEVGLIVERFPAVVHESPHHSFIQSQKAILQSITENTIVFEDDVQFMNMAKWDKVIESIPEDFDLAYLGGNDYWWRALDIWASQAIIYTPKGAQKILSMFEDDEMYDNWLARFGLYCLNGYICKPFLCGQYPSYSDIWRLNVDYTQIFEGGQNKLV
jgi:hypothetical protein